MVPGVFDALPASPFARLRGLLDDITPTHAPLSLALGEPQHAPPDFVMTALAQPSPEDIGRYPPIVGTPTWRAAAQGWLTRRFSLPDGFLCGENDVLPLTGTREGLFLAAQIAPPKADGLMAMPNPFYQVYASAAIAAGAQPLYLNATAETGFLPDLEALQAGDLARLRALYLCSPANPQGAIADAAYLRRALQLAEQHNFLLLVDECYSDIYDRAAPLSIVQIMAEDAKSNAPVLVFHSLSKRSNLAGLRSGFVSGGEDAMRAFQKLRMVAGPQTPLPHLAAAALAWGDDAHVAVNRDLYRAKLDAAQAIFGTDFDFYRPDGGFFLWLNVGDGETAARFLWREEGMRVLPGAYLTVPDADGTNKGAAYIRVALVAPLDDMRPALTRLHAALRRFAAHQDPQKGAAQ